MPRHGTGLGAGNFPAANKLLMRYEHDRAYKLHQQKLHNTKHRLDVTEPKKHNHLILRLKQIQKEEERQAEIDHENKLLLNKMTHVLKYGGNIDNWNNYESRSLNYPFRDKQNEEIARENLGIARRLENVKPKLTLNKWEKDYQQHQYLKRLWSDSVKDFGEFTPRRYRSRMSRTVKRSMETSLNDTYEEDFHSVATDEEKKLPNLKKEKKRKDIRSTKSETNAPVSHRKDESRAAAGGPKATKLPKIIPHKARSQTNDTKKDQHNQSPRHNNKIDKDNLSPAKKMSEKQGRETDRNKEGDNDKAEDRKEEDLGSPSTNSLQSGNYVTNDLERVKTLISESQDSEETRKEEDNIDSKATDNTEENKEQQSEQDVEFLDKQLEDKEYDEKKDADTCVDAENRAASNTPEDKMDKDSDDGKKTKSIKDKNNEKDKSEAGKSSDKKGLDVKESKKEDGISGQAKDNREDTSDVAQLFKIAKQLGKPEDIFTKTLVKKSHKQRMATKAKFRQKYDLDLVTELKNGLGQPWEYLIDALLQERGVADSYAVFDALSTADMSDVAELLCSRDNATIAELKESYRKEFSISLEEDITDRSQPPIQTLLLTLQKGVRDESSDVDEDAARKDAQNLFEYGEGRWDSENGIFLKLLTEKSFAHLHCVFNEYKSVAEGQDILDAMKMDCSKEYFKILLTVVQCIGLPSNYYADILHKHKLPSDPVFVGTLVLRSEVDMPSIRKAYKKLYSVDITDDIKSKPHPTQKCLVELAQKVPPGSKKKADARKTYVKDGAANQQSNPQPTSTKKPKKSKAKTKGQGQSQSEAGDSITGSTQADSEAKNSKAFEPKQAQQSKQKDNQDNVEKQKKGTNGANGGQNRGTLKPASNFRPDDDCDRLNGAMSGERTDEAVVVSIIPKRSNQQRQQLKSTYEQKFRKNLTIDLTSEMSGDSEEIILALMMTPSEYDAHIVREAVEGLGTSEPTLIAVLCTRSSVEMKLIKEHYSKGGGGDFDMDVTRDCGSDLKNLLLRLSKGEREDGVTVNMQRAQNDAKDIHQNGVLSVSYVSLVTMQNHFQVKATFEEFKKVSGEDIYSAIKKASLGDDEDVYISIAKAVEDPEQFYAEKIQGCFTGMGTNDNQLVRLVVPRSEVDLEDIKLRYYELYSRSLYDAINTQCKGDYKSLLLAVVNNDEKNKAGQQKKGDKQKATPLKSSTGGTVKPAKPFNPIEDSERLNAAMSGPGKDEAVIISILPKRTNDQRQEIKAKYEDKYSKNLQEQLESELRGDFEEIVLAMMMKPVDYACHCLHEAIKGLGTKEGILIGILCTKTGMELAVIKDRYKQTYGKELLEDITQDVSGGMEDLFKEILKCQREQTETADIQQAKTDAKRLYKEGQISIDPTDEVFKEIIARKSRAQVKATFVEYKKLTGKDIYFGIEKALIGDEKDAYLGLARAVEDPVMFYVQALHSSFDGLGTNYNRLIRIVVSRSEIDLADIKVKYKALYNKTVNEEVENECAGAYKNMLLAILGDL